METALFAVTAEPLEPAPLVSLVSDPSCGAIMTFAGVARDNFGGRATDHLEYEAYAEMAVAVLAEIAADAGRRFAIGKVAIHHRTGRLAIGETAVLVVVAAPHRQASFDAGAFIMDEIKARAPIWKREHWADGSQEWIGDEKTRPGAGQSAG
ncbi:MAG TPA: molybdenum cofactor biosynthesis protein MoaE [Herpetosiphonaceae bacterium]